MDIQANKILFINLLKGTKRPGIENLIDYLENKTDFFKAPASTKYHLAVEGGLVQHSLNVYKRLSKECGKADIHSPELVIVALLHDICKADYYKTDFRNVKIEGKWESVPYYTTDDKYPLGHGEKSVIIAQKFIQLTREEILAIRWHMGGFENKDNYNFLSRAFNESTLALQLCIADLKATYIDEK